MMSDVETARSVLSRVISISTAIHRIVGAGPRFHEFCSRQVYDYSELYRRFRPSKIWMDCYGNLRKSYDPETLEEAAKYLRELAEKQYTEYQMRNL